MTDKENCAYKQVRAASELHRVPGFDPLQYLRKETSPVTGEKVLKLDLRYKKMWFRLAYPKGRMLLTPLCVTSQTARFQASLYESRSDTPPLAQVMSQKDRQDTGSQYIQAAQDDALDQALDNAGFGIQLADLIQTAGGSGYGSEIPLSQIAAFLGRDLMEAPPEASPVEKPVSTAKVQPTMGTTQPTARRARETEATPPPAQMNVAAPANVNVPQSNAQVTAEPTLPKAVPQAETTPQVETAPQVETGPKPAQRADVTVDSEQDPVKSGTPVEGEHRADQELLTAGNDGTAEQVGETDTAPVTETASLLQMLGAFPVAQPQAERTAQTERPAVVDFPRQPEQQVQAVPTAPAPNPQAGPQTEVTQEETVSQTTEPVTYTPDMTVDEIRERMTLEQARALMVTFGPNKGWTLGQVADRRPSSLRFYLLLAEEASNEIKAGSALLMEEMAKPRAS